MRHGFESYLTGYALAGEGFYVLARTWYASEMQRPGCVWTHSLLLRKSDVAAILEGGALLRFFRRPESLTDTDSYSSKLLMSEQEAEWLTDVEQTAVLWNDLSLQILFSCLYGNPLKPVYIPAGNAKQYEDLVLRLWSQQWPELRTAFSFCSGSLGNRTVSGRPFDLQVIPRSALPEFRQELTGGSVIDGSSSSQDEFMRSGWLSAAIRDFVSGTNHGIRDIAWKLGRNLRDRENFPGVFYFAAVLQQREPFRTTAHQLANAIVVLPEEVKTPVSLLKALFGAPDSSCPILGVSDADILDALATVEVERLHSLDLDIPARVSRLWASDHDGALELFSDLIKRDLTTELGNQILVALCWSLEVEDVDKIADMRPGILSTVVRHKAALAAAPAVWKVQP